MFKSVEIRNLGPHERAVFDFAPDGATVISGPSKVGKTFALRAVCFALWGCDTDGRPLPSGAVRDGQERAEVTLTAASGTVVRRTLTRRGAVTRSIHRAGQSAPVRYNSDRDFAAALPTALASDAARIVAVPESWRDLAAGNARPLRDFLVALLPAADVAAVVARLMAPATLRPQDPLDEAGAVEGRRAANAARDRAAGALDAARAAAKATDGPTAAEITAADAAADAAARTIASDGEWCRYDDACARRAQAAERADRELSDWQRREAALPAEVPADERAAAFRAAGQAAAVADEIKGTDAAWRAYDDSFALARASREAAAAAAATAAEAREAHVRLRAAVAAREHACAEAEAATVGTCGACGQRLPVPGDLAGRCAAARAAEHSAEVEYRIAAQAATAAERHAAKVGAHEDPQQPDLPRPDAADVASAQMCAANAADAYRAIDRRSRERAVALRALGSRPAAEVPPPIQPPPLPRPSTSDVNAARAAVAAARDMRAQFSAAERQRTRAATVLAEAEAAIGAAEAEAALMDALVAAVRRAPSELARDRAAALGDMGPVTLAWGDGTAQSPAVTVLVDGRPWNLASTGAQVVADAYLRAAIRRIAKLVPLPIWIDRVQDVAGMDLPRPGSCVLLVTRDGALRCEADDNDTV